MKKIPLQLTGIFLLTALLLLSCRKDEPGSTEKPDEEIPTDIYVAGYSNETTTTGEVVWKNGTPLQVYDPTMLTTGYVRYANEIADLDLVDNDVYAIWKLSYKALSAYYATAKIYAWKNGINTLVKENDYNIYPRAIEVEGQDIYFAGHYTEQHSHPNIWKNGTRQQLPGGIGSVSDLLVNNSDVLAVGYVTSVQSSAAAFWKNAVLTKLGEGAEFNASSIAKNGNDVYVAGSGKLNSASGPRSALLWKNGTQQVLAIPSGSIGATAESVAASGDKIYVAGHAYTQQYNTFATVWINGIPTVLSELESEALSIAVKGNIAYACGYEKIENRSIAVVWKLQDGKVETIKLSKGTADAKAHSIKVK
jgi:hypothetical protein